MLILNNSAKMFKERWRRGTWITVTIGTKGISKKIKIGYIFRSKIVSITVRHIIANHFIEDMPD